ncbi:conserved hypothetical protein [Gammaproteobacteria bacterium]
MYQAVEAIVKSGQLVPVEPIALEENAHFLLVRLPRLAPVPVPDPGRMEAIRAVRGKYRDQLSSIDEFIARKQEEKALEE